jgi:polyhydroxybutyrate depolymerase
MDLSSRVLRAAVLSSLSLGGLSASAAVAPHFAERTGAIVGLAGKCVDVAASGTTNGTAVQLYTCAPGVAQTWTISDNGTIRNPNSGKCLDVTGQGTVNGSPIQLWDCNGSGAQQWVYSASTQTLLNPQSGRCLDVTGQSSADRTRLQIWECNGQTNQKWQLPGETSTCTRAVAAGDSTLPVTFNGVRYNVAVYVPSGVASTTRLPLVLDLHGTGSSGAGQITYSNIKSAAQTNKFAVIAPSGAIASGSGFAWNVPGVTSGPRDDVAFLDQVITTMESTLCGEPNRVFAAGYSGGARMSSAYACARPNRLAGLAAIAGLRAGRPDPANTSQPEAAACQPASTVPVIAFHGQQDSTNPYDGGGSSVWQYSVPAAQKRWASLNGCASTPTTVAVSSHVSKLTYSGCRDGAEVVLYRISDGGHTWPGTPQPSTGNGNTTQEIDANSLLWSFFAAH